MVVPRIVPSAMVGPPGNDWWRKGGKGNGENTVPGFKGRGAGEQRSSPYGAHGLGLGHINIWAGPFSSDTDNDESDGVSEMSQDLTAGAVPLPPPAALPVAQQILPERFHCALRCVRADQVVTTDPPLFQSQRCFEDCRCAADPSRSASGSASAAAPGAGVGLGVIPLRGFDQQGLGHASLCSANIPPMATSFNIRPMATVAANIRPMTTVATKSDR